MSITAYFASLSLIKLVRNLPGGIAQGLIWGLMALGIYVTFRLLDVADLTVDGSFATGRRSRAYSPPSPLCAGLSSRGRTE